MEGPFTPPTVTAHWVRMEDTTPYWSISSSTSKTALCQLPPKKPSRSSRSWKLRMRVKGKEVSRIYWPMYWQKHVEIDILLEVFSLKHPLCRFNMYEYYTESSGYK